MTSVRATEPQVDAVDQVAAVDDAGSTAAAVGPVDVPDVARPRRAHPLHELPLALVLIGTGAGLVVIAAHHFRWGNILIGGSVLFAALLRLVLPTRRAGLLAVRSRFTDVFTMAVAGGALVLLALVTST